LDLDQLASYGLVDPAAELLATAARWEIRSLLDRGFRPRTACDLEIDEGADLRSLPTLDHLTEQLADLVGRCGALLGDGNPLEVVWDRKKHAKKAGSSQDVDPS
ncbi:MAG: type I-G CRISPR-associated RAMP protein Csb1/Cas7g, partial [Acidimicrobiales bacterium]